jgi:putative nucleotidyltransferase-like protein
MTSEISRTHQYLEILSRLMFRGYSAGFQKPATNLESVYSDVEYLSTLNESELSEFLRVADIHHVSVRALQVVANAANTLGHSRLSQWCESILATEHARIERAIGFLERICRGLEAAGCKVSVIKSLDHWPDLGSDLDLYTSGDEHTVARVMTQEFKAEQEARSWGDRLANKWNFSVPGLPELVEIHVQYLGQTGEHKLMARRVVERSVTKELNGHIFRVPAPEERVVISTLQRMYRHFYFRLCDMADFASLLQTQAIDFVELRRAADVGGIWPGVATFLALVSDYVNRYGGKAGVPAEVVASSCSPNIRVQARGDFLRVPMLPAASLYGSQLLNASRHRDLRAMCRLPLLPPLAVSALVAFRLTGSDKGIW